MEMERLAMTPVRQVTLHAESHLGETEVKAPVKTFGEYLTDSLKKTNELIHESDKWNAALAAGKVEDLSQVIVAGQKAEIATQLTLQIRNRAVSAYQEIMRMQV
ncbi:MAG: flagellar hook-basal body complex protein FliE [Selenomonadaceae bacterium]|nr:flagellar hook-basal body complex protein FliE [Selenomonadaceae bacterium]